MDGGRDGRRCERDREVEGDGALEPAAACRSTSIMGTLHNLCHLEVEGPRAAG